MQTEQAIDLGYRKGQPDEDNSPKLTKYEVYQVNRTSHSQDKG